MDLPDFLARLERVKKSPNGEWSARCPAHHDRSPSLSVTEQSGRILVNCHAGTPCTAEQIVAALGLTLRDLFTEPREREQRRIEATYDYLDEHGKLLFQTVRFAPKDFAQRRPDGNGDWIWNLEGVHRVLYRLPEVLRTDGVIVVEGEKDAETARRLGFVATCNPLGAGKWRSEFSQALQGKEVVISPDADESGRRHGQEIAHSLLYRAREIKILELPGAKDLSDWVEKGGTTEALCHLLAECPLWVETEKAGKPKLLIQAYEAHEFRTVHFSDNGRPLLPPFIECQGRGLIIGDPKTLKSMLAFCLAYEASCGLQPLGLDKYPPPQPIRTLYGQLEDRRGETQKRYDNFVRSHGDREPEPGMLHIVARQSLNLMETGSRSAFEKLLAARKPQLTILDVMRKLFPGDPSNPPEVRAFLDYLDEIIERFETALLLVHYTPKNSTKTTASGTSYLDGWPELILHVHHKRQTNKCTMAQVSFVTRGEEIPPLTVIYDPHSSPILSAHASDSLALEHLRLARRFLGAAFGIRDVAEVLSCTYDWARHWITDWQEEGLLRIAARTGRGGTKRFSFVPLPGEKRPEPPGKQVSQSMTPPWPW